MTINTKDIKNPIIVLAGDHGTGKTFVQKQISKYVQTGITLNKYDFITRRLLYLLNIHPLMVNYILIKTDTIDRELFVDDANLNYLKKEITKNGKITIENIKYFIENILFVNVTKCPDVVINKLFTVLNNLLLSNKTGNLKPFFYELTTLIFDNIISKNYIWEIEEHVNKYLNNYFNDLKMIYTKYKKRIIYYAYSDNEIKYFKNNFNAPVIYINMKSSLQTQLLLKDGKNSQYSTVISPKQQQMVLKMKELSDFIIDNNLEMSNIIVNKIMNELSI